MQTNPSTSTKETLKPEWLRIPGAVQVSGLSRSLLYQAISSGEIKSSVIKKRGNVRGVRLISFDSLMQFIEAGATGGRN